MARVYGPLHSFEAHGQVGKTLIYEEWRGRFYVKAYAVPTLRRYPSQRAIRAIVQFLTDQWKTAPPVLKPTWEALGVKENTSGIAAFCKYNFARCWTGQAPSIIYPADLVGPGTTLQYFTAVGGVGVVNLSAYWTTKAQKWAVCVYSKTEIGNPTEKEIVAIFEPNVGSPAAEFQVKNVEPGTYLYYARVMSEHGSITTTPLGPYGVDVD